MLYKVSWARVAKLQLIAACNYIKKDSPANAVKVRRKIIAATRSLETFPEKHAADIFNKNNDWSFRAFEIFSYMISYKIEEAVVTIRRVRHTSM
jgi:plasmid stabilization system protein ParE